jgi:hypothetical protein
VATRSPEDRAWGIRSEHYERIYALFAGEASAKDLVAATFQQLRDNPEDSVALEPAFVALLPLVSRDYDDIVRHYFASDEDLRAMQRQLAREYEGVRTSFPHLASGT